MADDDPRYAKTLADDVSVTPDEQRAAPAGYQFHELIGKGGMGEVLAATDDHLGREVAIKRMRASQPEPSQISRFLREARIQARLDHPAIVPVYELGTDTAGRPFFVMKRIGGRTMAQRMLDNAPAQTLLRNLVEVSLAIDLAHSRGVVHRDLKPENIMLGDYGEVYVLDWGIARVVTERPSMPAMTAQDVETLDDGTQTGAMLGTPGYIAPEVIRGEPARSTADVYALGCMLFEILSAQSLHPRGTAAIAATLSQPQERPTHRAAGKPIPPELDALCFESLAENPADRPTARQFADRVQRYLDGDRDLASRRTAAEDQLAKARHALTDASGAGRQEAIARAGRALALAPEWDEARALVTELIVRPADVLPPQLVESLRREESEEGKQSSRIAFFGLAGLFIAWLVIPFLGIQGWPWLIALYASLLVHTTFTWRASKTGKLNIPLGLTTALIFIVCSSRLAGIWIITPVLMCGVLLAFTAAPTFRRRRWLLPLWTGLAFGVPLALEWLHVLPGSWQVNLDNIVSVSTIFRMQGWYADAALIGSNAGLVLVVGAVAIRLHHAQRRARRELAIQNWHMNQLVPNERRGWATEPQAALDATRQPRQV